MLEHNPSSLEQQLVQPETTRSLEIKNRPEYAMACKNTARGGDLIRELFRLGVPKNELKPFALARLAEYIRNGYGLNAIQGMAGKFSKSGAERLRLISSLEVEQMFIETRYDMMHEIKTKSPSEPSPAETEEEQIQRGLEMAALYE